MSKYKFTPAQRNAVYTVHGEKCYQCGMLLTMKTVEIDHIIPESLRGKNDELAKVLSELGRPASFDIDSYENWMPSCRKCNGEKSNMNWEPSLAVQRVLQRAKAKASEAESLTKRFASERSVADALSVLEQCAESGQLTDDVKASLRPLVEAQVALRAPERAKDPVRVTPSYEVPLYAVLSESGGNTLVEGPHGVGGGPSARNASWGVRCGSCGHPFFNGARCVICGQMDDGD